MPLPGRNQGEALWEPRRRGWTYAAAVLVIRLIVVVAILHRIARREAGQRAAGATNRRAGRRMTDGRPN